MSILACESQRLCLVSPDEQSKTQTKSVYYDIKTEKISTFERLKTANHNILAWKKFLND